MTRLAFAVMLGLASAVAADPHFTDVRTSAIVNKRVIDLQGKPIGEVDDLVLEPAGNRVRYAVVGSGGVLGLGRERRAYPLAAFSLEGESTLRLDASVRSGSPRGQDGLAAREVIGRKVHHREGRYLGEIRDLVVNLGTGELRHVVLSLGEGEAPVAVPAASVSLPADGKSSALVTGLGM